MTGPERSPEGTKGGGMGDRTGNGAGGRRPDRRRQYFIHRPLQGRFALCFLGLGLLIAFGTGGAIWYLSSQELERHLFRSHVAPVGPWDVVFPILFRSLLVSIGGLLLFSFVVTRSVFRKISGELGAVDEAMCRIGAGDLKTNVPEGRVAELNETLDAAREAMRKRVVVLRDLQERMAEEVDKIRSEDESVCREIGRLCLAFRAAMPDAPSGESGKTG
jgi:hypothetical protein